MQDGVVERGSGVVFRRCRDARYCRRRNRSMRDITCMRVRTRKRCRMAETCSLTVFSVSPSLRAMTLFGRPSSTNASTEPWRGVRPSSAGVTGMPWAGPNDCDRPDRASSDGKLVSPASTLRTAAVKALASRCLPTKPQADSARARPHDFRCGFGGHEDKARGRNHGLEGLHGIEASAVIKPDIKQHDIGTKSLIQRMESLLGATGSVDCDVGHHLRKKCGGAGKSHRMIIDHQQSRCSVRHAYSRLISRFVLVVTVFWRSSAWT